MSYSETKGPTYKIISIGFSSSSSLSLKIEQDTYYKKIIRYYTYHYIKTPVYSDWKLRTKIISERLSIDPFTLENLPNNPDPILAAFATEIINRVFGNSQDYWPSWYQMIVINDNYKSRKTKIDEKYNLDKANIERTIDDYENTSNDEASALRSISKSIALKTKKKSSIEKKVAFSSGLQKNPLLGILTLGIYAYLRGGFHKNHLNKKYQKVIKDISDLESLLKDKEKIHEETCGKIRDETDKETALAKKYGIDSAVNDNKLSEDMRNVHSLVGWQKPKAKKAASLKPAPRVSAPKQPVPSQSTITATEQPQEFPNISDVKID